MSGNDFIDKFHPRAIFPSRPAVKLSEKMRELAVPKHVSQRWMAAEMSKLVPEAVRLEEAQIQWAAAGVTAGVFVSILFLMLTGGS